MKENKESSSFEFTEDQLTQINKIPFLSTLCKKKKLSYSEGNIKVIKKNKTNKSDFKVGELNIKLFVNKKLTSSIKECLSKDCITVFDESLENISNSYNKLNEPAIGFFNELIEFLLTTLDNPNAYSSFEGLSIEKAPFLYKDGTRADHYYYNDQKIRVCTSNFPISMNSDIMTLLAHEFTHAVDDICCNVISIESFLSFLVENCDSDINIRPIIQITAHLLDKELYSLYVKQFFDDINTAKEVFKFTEDIDFLVFWYKEGKKTFQDDNGNTLNSFQSSDGSVVLTNGTAVFSSTVPAEFLAFYIEKIFFNIKSDNFESNIKDWFNVNILTAGEQLTPYINTGIDFINYIGKSFLNKLNTEKSIVRYYIEQTNNVLNSLKTKTENVTNPIKIDFDSLNSNLKALKGAVDNLKETPIEYINSYFGKYTIDALVNILQLRVSNLDDCSDIKIFQGLFINRNLNNITEVIKEVIGSDKSTVLLPINLFNKHAVGLIFERITDNSYHIKYIDPMNKSIPQELLQIIQDILPNSYYEQITVEQQKYANCGPEVIENFILSLTGNRVSQEKAIELHSKLVENSLLDLPISKNTHLLFEQPDYYGYQPDICLSGNYDQETC